MATPTENWPKPWMLQLHEQAVEQGFIWVEGISEADYQSLKSRLYRIRRRGDKSMAAFIKPEYHLVMVGNWEPTGHSGAEPGDLLGRFPMIFNRKADGTALPTVRAATGEEVDTYVPTPRAEPAVIPLSAEDLTIGEDDITSLVDSLKSQAAKRRQG